MDPRKDPILAGILSGLVPGLGQVYCRCWLRGGLFMGGSLLALFLVPPLGPLLAIGLWIAAIVDAYRLARGNVEEDRRPNGQVIDVTPRRLPPIDFRRAVPYVLGPAAIVLVVLGVIAFVMLRRGFRSTADGGNTWVLLERLADRVERHKDRTGAYPATLDALIDPNDPLERRVLLDSWGRPFRYRLSRGTFELTSDGRDGRPGTEDDVVGSH